MPPKTTKTQQFHKNTKTQKTQVENVSICFVYCQDTISSTPNILCQQKEENNKIKKSSRKQI